MKRLNKKSEFRVPTVKADPQVERFTFGGKNFVYDKHGMGLWEVDDPDQPIPVALDRKPQFRCTAGTVHPMVVVLEASQACPLACKYCFAADYSDHASNIDFQTAKQAIQTYLGWMKKSKETPSIGFFGGEPMVAWDVLAQVVTFAEGFFAPKEPKFSITTNAVLLNEEKAKFLVDHGFSFIVSLDGSKDLHDRMRVFPNGKGSYDVVRQGLELLKDAGTSRITLRSTYTPGAEFVVDRIEHLNKLCDEGYGDWVSVEPVCLTESHCLQPVEGYTVEKVRSLESDFLKLAEWAISRYKNGKKVRAHVIVNSIRRLLHIEHSVSECFTGDTKVSLLDGRDVPIKDLVNEKSFWVYSYDLDKQRIVPGKAKAICSGTRNDLVEVELDNGEKIHCTSDHEWLTRDGSYVKAETLQPGQSLMPLQKSSLKNHKVVAVRPINEQVPVYDLQVEKHHNFALSAGVFVHNCGAGLGYLSFDYEGNIYACHRMNFGQIGNIHEGGIDAELQAPWIDNRSYAREECNECVWQWACGGGCREASLGDSGDIHKPYKPGCEFMKLYLKTAAYIISKVPRKILEKEVKPKIKPSGPKCSKCGKPKK